MSRSAARPALRVGDLGLERRVVFFARELVQRLHVGEPAVELVHQLDVFAHARHLRRHLTRRDRRRPTDRARSPALRARRAGRAPRRCAGTCARRRHAARDQRSPRRSHAYGLTARDRACTSCRCHRSTVRCGPASSRPAPAVAGPGSVGSAIGAFVVVVVERQRHLGGLRDQGRLDRIRTLHRILGRAVGHVADLGPGLLVDHDLQMEHVADEVVFDLAHHRLEHVEAFALPLRERVLLAHGPQVDALLEVVHLVEVLAPVLVDHREHHAAFDVAQRVGADLSRPSPRTAPWRRRRTCSRAPRAR